MEDALSKTRQWIGVVIIMALTWSISMLIMQWTTQTEVAYGRLEPKPVMTFTVDDQVRFQDNVRDQKDLGEYLQAVINLPDYWGRAGIKFEYRKTGPANFTFHYTYERTVWRECGDDLAHGCEVSADPGSCVIWVGVDAYRSHGYLRYRLPPDELWEHEMGHCLGFQHTHGGLMNPTMDYYYMPYAYKMFPTRGMIRDLRSRMNRPWWTQILQ